MRIEEEEITKLVKAFYKNNKWIVRLFDSFEDMLQTLICHCYLKLRTFDEDKGKLSTYIYLCCKTKCLLLYRTMRIKHKYYSSICSLDEPINETDEITLGDSIEDGSDFIQDLQNKELYKISVEKIRPETYDYYVNEMCQVDIAKKYGVTQSRISRAIIDDLKKVRKELEGDVEIRKSLQADVQRIMNSHKCSRRTAYRILERNRKKMGETA